MLRRRLPAKARVPPLATDKAALGEAAVQATGASTAESNAVDFDSYDEEELRPDAAVDPVEEAPRADADLLDPFEERLKIGLEEQRATLEEAALETVNSMLANLRLPTLKQALEDLGLPVTGAKDELTARLTDRLTSGIVSGRRE